MRSELWKNLRKWFRQRMSAEFPEYGEDQGQTIPQATYVWTHHHTSGIWFHVLLVIHPMDDRFTLETAWDFDGKLPCPSYNEVEGRFERPVLFRMNFTGSSRPSPSVIF